MKNKNVKTENGPDGGRADFMLKAYAAQNKGKYGDDGEMFASLREDYKREKSEKAPKRRAERGTRLRKLLMPVSAAAAALIITCAILIPVLLKDNTPEYEVLDGLYVIPVAEAQLQSELGFNPAIPRPEGYSVNAINIYKNEGGEIKAYSLHYSNPMNVETKKIEIFCVINNDFIFSMENIIDREGKNQIFASKIIRIYVDDKNESICRFTANDYKYVITLKRNDPDFLSWIIHEYNI